MGLKQELKENDIVELKNGEIRKIKLQGDNSLSVEDCCSLNNYDDNLHYYDKTKKYDIIKIYKYYKRLDILTDEERSYLKNLIKPFRNKIYFISKSRSCIDNKEYIRIGIKDDSVIVLPDFNKNEYYEGMERDKDYCLEELGL